MILFRICDQNKKHTLAQRRNFLGRKTSMEALTKILPMLLQKIHHSRHSHPEFQGDDDDDEKKIKIPLSTLEASFLKRENDF